MKRFKDDKQAEKTDKPTNEDEKTMNEKAAEEGDNSKIILCLIPKLFQIIFVHPPLIFIHKSTQKM